MRGDGGQMLGGVSGQVGAFGKYWRSRPLVFSLLPDVPVAASASCTGDPPPAKAVFVGTVTATDNDGRRATVTTDDGRTVTVLAVGTFGPSREDR